MVSLVALMYQPSHDSVTSTLPWNLGDPALNISILAWESHALVEEPTRLLEGYMFHPYGEALKYSEIMLPLVVVFGPLAALTDNLILAYNVTTLLLSLFAVICAWLLGKRLVGPWGGLLAAVGFSFCGYVFMHQSHLQLLTLGFFPLAFLTLFNTLETRRTLAGVGLGVVTALLTMSSLYYGAVWFVCLGLVLVVDWIRLRRPGGEWWKAVAAASLTIVLLVGPLAYSYARFQTKVPFARDVGELGLNPIDFVTPAPGSLAYQGLYERVIHRQPTGSAEHGFFLGLLLPALLLIGLFLRTERSNQERGRRSNRYEMTLLTSAGLVSMLLALGPEVRGVPMPLRLFQLWVPGFDSIRAASRLAVPGILAVSVLAGWAFRALLGRFDRDQRLVATSLVVALVLVELYVTPIRIDVPDVEPVRPLLREAPDGAVVELPMRETFDPEFAFIEGPRLLASVGDWRPRFNGYSGGLPPGYMEDVVLLNSFPSDQAFQRMSELDLRYVILHGAESPNGEAYDLPTLERIVSALPEDVLATKAGDDWLVDLGAGG